MRSQTSDAVVVAAETSHLRSHMCCHPSLCQVLLNILESLKPHLIKLIIGITLRSLAHPLQYVTKYNVKLTKHSTNKSYYFSKV